MPSRRLWIALAATALVGLTGCGAGDGEGADGQLARGQQALDDYGCVSCHAIDGVRSADGRVGPRLDGFADQRIIAGAVPNSEDNLVAWIRDPQEIVPGTAMPDTGVPEEDARAIAAYLHSLTER